MPAPASLHEHMKFLASEICPTGGPHSTNLGDLLTIIANLRSNLCHIWVFAIRDLLFVASGCNQCIAMVAVTYEQIMLSTLWRRTDESARRSRFGANENRQTERSFQLSI